MEKKEKYFCRTCKGFRKHTSLYKKEVRGGTEEDFIQWIEEFHIVECDGCETISFLKVYGNSEMYHQLGEENIEYYTNKTIYPEYIESGNELNNLYLLPQIIEDIYRETIATLKADSRVLAAGGLRAIIEATCNHLKIKKGTLEQRIDLLSADGHLSTNEAKRLHSIRFLGNDALHEIEKPKKKSLILLLDIVNHLLANLFINDKLIDGKVDKVVDSYSDFLSLLKSNIKKDKITLELTLEDLLGKSIRLIPKNKIDKFKEQFRAEVLDSKHSFISFQNAEKSTKFKILKVPDFFFDF